ncbi:TetR/AcrR family transcriptional regulator [Mycolicibacterium aurum]|nr:TetR/AcrR family transcriptional regulator [Mycolicibacterium aurum]
MDAAERSILLRGYRSSTMQIIAREAGYSRAAMYQQFPNRNALLEALVHRKTLQHQAQIGARLPRDGDLADLLVESLVIVASELISDPLLQTLSEQTDDGTVAYLVAGDLGLPEQIERLVIAMRAGHSGHQIREGLLARDIGHFIITTALTLLLGIIPGTQDPEIARRYLRNFFIPAIFESAPVPVAVFPAETP